jgi:uncharacterized repeat protein (TIGR01451 family)
MKKKIFFCFIVMLALVIPLTLPIWATSSSFIIDPYWMADPLDPGHSSPDPATPPDSDVEGYWWRDTANQNALADYTEDQFTGEVVKVYSFRLFNVYVYCSKGISNATVIQTVQKHEEGDPETPTEVIDSYDVIVIGTGGGTEAARAAKAAIAAAFPVSVPITVKGIVITSPNLEQLCGAPVWYEGQAAPPIYAAEGCIEKLNHSGEVFTGVSNRYDKVSGVGLSNGPDAFLGSGTTAETNSLPTETPVLPDTIITEQTQVVYNKVPFTLVPCAADGCLMAWIPGHKILFPYDLFGSYLPDTAPLTGPVVPVQNVISDIQTMLSYNPNFYIPQHTRPTIGNSDTITCLTMQKSALAYIHDQTIKGINLGKGPGEIAGEIVLPAILAASPYNQEFVNSTASIVKGIYYEYMGWFDGEADKLTSTLNEVDKAEILVELAGGLENLIAQARTAELNARDLAGAEKALFLAHAACLATPADSPFLIEVKQVYAQALRKNAYMQKSAQIRNYYLATAQNLGLDSLLLPPGLTDFEKSAKVNNSITFTAEDFSLNFNHNGGELDRVQINSLPEHGTLSLTDSGDIISGQEIKADKLGGLVFSPDTDWSGDTSFDWNACGSSGKYADTTASVTVHINSWIGMISGQIYTDANGNRVRDSSENGLANVTIQLQSTSGSILKDTATGADGTYSFSHLLPGTYRLRSVLPAGNYQTTPDPQDILLSLDQNVTGVDFGCVFSADISVTMTAKYYHSVVTYTITLTNNGPAEARDVILSGSLPKDLVFLSAFSKQASIKPGNNLNVNFGTLARGSSATVILNAKWTNVKKTPVYTVTSTTSTFDINRGNNTATVK